MKRNKTIKRVGAILVSMVVAMQVFTGCASKPGSESTVMREITTMELVKEM